MDSTSQLVSQELKILYLCLVDILGYVLPTHAVCDVNEQLYISHLNKINFRNVSEGAMMQRDLQCNPSFLENKSH